jgi:hypothetical protein
MRKQVEAKFKKGDRVRVIQDTLNILWHPDKMEGVNNQDGGKEFTVANAQNSTLYNPKLLSMYREEHPLFREALYDVAQVEAARAWITLDKIMG